METRGCGDTGLEIRKDVGEKEERKEGREKKMGKDEVGKVM